MPGTNGKYLASPKTLGDGEEQQFLLDASGSMKVVTSSNSTTTSAKREDDPHTSLDVGSFVLGIRRDALASNTSAAGDYSEFAVTDSAQLIVKEYSPAGSDWQYAAAPSGISNTTTAVTIKAAGGAGLRNYITGIDFETNGALGAATEIAIRDGAAGTVIWRGQIGTAGLAGGRSVQFITPLRGSVATLLEFVTLTATVTGAVYFNAQGFVGP